MGNHQKLSRSCKGKFAFSLATTSFIYPASWEHNARMLAPFVDEIELLLFESRYPGSFPTQEQISRMKSLSKTHGLSYNVHLPLDISLGDMDKEKRHRAVETVIRALKLTAPLSPATCTLHWTYEREKTSTQEIRDWRTRLATSMEEILSNGFSPDLFSIENLDYPFTWATPLIQELDLRVCLDIGHLIQRRESFVKPYFELENRIDILHIYGVTPDRDHSGLDSLDRKNLENLWQILASFGGTVSVEVFSRKDLENSMKILLEDREHVI